MPEVETWLIVSHAFNMDGRAASQVITDKIPHLIARGITPIVISAMTGKRDDVVEHHRLLPVSPAGLRFDLRHLVRQHVTGKTAYKLLSGLVSIPLLPFYMVERLVLPLEPQWSWFVPAYVKGARLIRKRGCKVIYSTGGAASAHLAAYLLARRFALPWVAEIHDPMVSRDSDGTRMRHRFAAWLERKICERADVAIWFVETAMERAVQRNPVLGSRGKVLSPGADRPNFGKIGYARGPHLAIGHFGMLAPTRNLDVFLQALGEVLRRRPELADVIRVELYGGGVDALSAKAIAALPSPDIVRSFGRLERDPDTGDSGRDRVLKRMQTVDALLLLHGTDAQCEEYIPSKLYEYLWAERPIIGLTWQNPHLDRILRENGHWTVPANDVHAITTVLEQLIARWQADDLKDSGMLSPFTVGAAVDQILRWVDEARCPARTRKEARR